MADALLVTRKRDGLHLREIDGETIVLDRENHRMHSLNVTAAFVFEEIDGRRTVKEIWENLAKCFEITMELAERDTKKLVEQLRELRLVL